MASASPNQFPTSLVQIAPNAGEDQIRQRLEEARRQLEQEAGITHRQKQHFHKPIERPFTKSQRAHTTVLFGGLTWKHEHLVQATLHNLGYKCQPVPTPDKRAFQLGKEYGNNGQCNPTYFTVGNLVNYLKDLRDKKGLETEQILKDYVFVTAGTCGPCRFGMYEAEYRLALRNSGFDGFRVLLFDQSGGTQQESEGAGIEFNIDLFLALLNAIFIGDLLNEVAYSIRPYEVVPGSTNAALADCLKICQEALETRNYAAMKGGRLSRFLSKRLPLGGQDDLAKLLDQLFGDTYLKAFRKCRDLLNERVEVDYTRPRPIAKVTGEFWAQTTEGDGNFHMFSFLEGEGAQVLVEPIATWVAYILFAVVQNYRDSGGLADNEQPPGRWQLGKRLQKGWKFRSTLGLLNLAEGIVGREYERLRMALGGTAHKLVNQLELQRLGNPYYNSRAEGGEGHMEIAKNIYYANNELAHMVLSLKPFGCMPSTQSDGAQAAVVSHFPDMIYLPIETSGEGDINAYSRVQMALGAAKAKAKTEFAETVKKTGYTLEQIQQYVAEHRELRRPLQHIPHHKGHIGQAANFVLHVAQRMKTAKS